MCSECSVLEVKENQKNSMIPVPDEVRCAVCKNIFCCAECRIRHEASSHSQNDVWNERNRMQCEFCKGSPTMEFRNRNDFALIMHLCQSHLPLHCKRCLTQFNSIGDFTMENKCVHINDGCSLHTASDGKIDSTCEKHNKETSNINFITANCVMHKSSFDRSNIADNSVLSLKNYSSILHNSNNTLYKTHSPNALAKALERQTSTPMHQNLMVFKSPETNGGCGSCSCSISSGSSQMSSISSESDTSPQTFTETNETTRHDHVHHHQNQNIVVTTQKKTTTIKRSKQSLAMTPLTRQVMTKSIHRAILEYQHSQCGPVMSPRSPLDLRTSIVIRREVYTSPDKTSSTSNNGVEPSKIGAKLETVFEQVKDVDDENKENLNGNANQAKETNNDHLNDTIDNSNHQIVAIKETPIPVSRKLSTEKMGTSSDGEIWFTPRETTTAKVIDVVNEIYTPKVTKKRHTSIIINETSSIEKRTDDDDYCTPAEQSKMSKMSETKKSSSKLWSFVSTILRFATLTPAIDPKNDTLSDNSIESPAVVKRCASMADVLGERNSDEEETEPNNRSQPIKRRRIQSMHASIEEQNLTTTSTYRRIQGRRPLRRMQESF